MVSQGGGSVRVLVGLGPGTWDLRPGGSGTSVGWVCAQLVRQDRLCGTLRHASAGCCCCCCCCWAELHCTEARRGGGNWAGVELGWWTEQGGCFRECDRLIEQWLAVAPCEYVGEVRLVQEGRRRGARVSSE